MELDVYQTINRPWLIQRGSFREIEEKDIAGLDSLISYDYMGSTEFECGALNYSLKRITHSWDEYIWFKIKKIKDTNDKPLYVLCRKAQKEDILHFITLMARDEPSGLKERAGLCSYITARSEYDLKTNFWWDVTSNNPFERMDTGNDWMACFGKNMRKLIVAINKVCEKQSWPK